MDTSMIGATPTSTAAAFAAELRANVAEWYSLPNTPETYAAFGERNRATWQAIQDAGVEIRNDVERILRQRS